MLQSLPKLFVNCRVPTRAPEMLSPLASGTFDDSMGVCGVAPEMLWRNRGVLIRGVVDSSGAVKVSAPILPLVTGRLKVERRRLDRPERRPYESPFFVGVGGISSTLDWLSVIRFAVGEMDTSSSSPSTLT